MIEFFQKMFQSDFMPHGMCYLWNPPVLWLNVIADGLIAAAYYAIPAFLFFFYRRRKDIGFRWVFVAFAAFILACGTTHVMAIWTVWHGTYRLDGVIKAATAGASVLTAILLVPFLPWVVRLPSPSALEALNRQLQDEIEERRLLMEALERQASLLDLAHDAIVVRSLDGAIQFWSLGAEEVYGWPKQEAVGRISHELLGAEFPEPLEKIHERVMAHGRWDGELTHRKRDGSRVVVTSRWALRRGNGAGGYEVMEINSDITREKNVREELRTANQELEKRVAARTHALGESTASLEKVNQELRAEIEKTKWLEEQLLQTQKMEAIGRLAGGVAHDFNNLLTVISGYNHMILDEPANISEVMEWAGEVEQAAESAASLTQQLLAFSRRQVLQPRIVDMNVIVRRMEKLLRRVIGEDIDLATHLEPGLARVSADPGHLEQVVMNLVVNARDAMPQGGKLTIETCNITLDEEYAELHSRVKPGEYVELAISDTGDGMSEETRQRIFEPFFTTKEMGKGTGLGLSIVYGIVKQNGGEIWVYSQLGKGTTFKIYLPVATVNGSEEPVPAATAAPRKRTEIILLVEDDPAVRKLVRSMLHRTGHTVLETQTGQDAIQICRSRPEQIDLVLTDVVMPDLSGPELAEQLTNIRPGMRVLYMSGYADNAVVRHGVLPPNAPFIQKPFTAQALNNKIRDILDEQNAAI